MDAMNDRVINVPIRDDNIAKRVNSLPRTDKNSGMVNIGLKRKLSMKNVHKHGLINPDRVYKACKFLVENHPDYKNINLSSYDEWVHNCPSLFDPSENSDGEEKEHESEEEDPHESNEKVAPGEAMDNDFNASTCLYPKEPALDIVVNNTKEKKKIKFKRKDKNFYEYAPGQKYF